MRRAVSLLLPLLLPGLLALPTSAQRQADEARLTIGVGLLHASGGGSLWRVGQQPILGGGSPDTVAVERRLTSGLGLNFAAAYFPSRYYGFAGEIVVQRLGSADDCTLRSPSPTIYTEDLCGSLHNIEFSTGTAAFAAGLLLRPGLRGSVQPYGRAMLGFVVVQQSLALMEGLVRSPNGIASASVYRDEDATSTSPYVALGAGFAAGLGPGWQLRFEARDSWLRLPAVLGPTSRQGVEPRVGRRGHHLLSLTVSVDVVLERKRGRRY